MEGNQFHALRRGMAQSSLTMVKVQATRQMADTATPRHQRWPNASYQADLQQVREASGSMLFHSAVSPAVKATCKMPLRYSRSRNVSVTTQLRLSKCD